MASKLKIPNNGAKIEIDSDLKLHIPDKPIIPYITGDGIGEDITPSMQEVVSAAVKKAYGLKKEIIWMEVFAGEKATKIYFFKLILSLTEFSPSFLTKTE